MQKGLALFRSPGRQIESIEPTLAFDKKLPPLSSSHACPVVIIAIEIRTQTKGPRCMLVRVCVLVYCGGGAGEGNKESTNITIMPRAVLVRVNFLSA